MIIGFTGPHRSGKTTTAKELEKLGWIRVREYISNSGYRIMTSKQQFDTPDLLIAIGEEHINRYTELRNGKENAVFDRTLHDLNIVAFIMCKPLAYRKFLDWFDDSIRQVKYNKLFYFEPIEGVKKLKGVEIAFNTLIRWKLKPICDVIVPFMPIDDRVQFVLNNL